MAKDLNRYFIKEDTEFYYAHEKIFSPISH